MDHAVFFFPPYLLIFSRGKVKAEKKKEKESVMICLLEDEFMDWGLFVGMYQMWVCIAHFLAATDPLCLQNTS